MRSYRPGKWYRSRRGLIFGVCQGLADWKELPVGILRFIVIFAFLFIGGVIAAITYTALAIILSPEPMERNDEPEWKKRFFS